MTRKHGTGTARGLRKRQTIAEAKLWYAVRNRQIDGWKFRRQVPIGPYVVDFLCSEARLIVELDGIQHLVARARHDQRRKEFLEREGFRVIRFWNADVAQNVDAVLGAIWRAIHEQGVLYRIPRPVHRYDASRSPLARPEFSDAPSPRPSPRWGEGGVPASEDGE